MVKQSYFKWPTKNNKKTTKAAAFQWPWRSHPPSESGNIRLKVCHLQRKVFFLQVETAMPWEDGKKRSSWGVQIMFVPFFFPLVFEEWLKPMTYDLAENDCLPKTWDALAPPIHTSFLQCTSTLCGWQLTLYVNPKQAVTSIPYKDSLACIVSIFQLGNAR